jgi:hypothetical protein
MPINETNIIGLCFFVCLVCIALWRIYAKWHSYRNLQQNGRIIWATVTDIKSEMRTIPISTRQILKSEDFLYMVWKDAKGENEQKFKMKVPDAYTPKIGEMLPIRVSPDGFYDYRLDLKQLQSRPASITKKPQVLKGIKDYDTVFDNKEEYTMPEASYPLQMSERKSQQNE